MLSFVFLGLAYYSYTPPIQNNSEVGLSQQNLVLNELGDVEYSKTNAEKVKPESTNGNMHVSKI